VGECTAGEGPFYNEEWTGAAWETLRTYLAPMAMSAEVERAADISGLMRKVRGNRMAKAAIETACWDLEARHLGIPLWKHLGGLETKSSVGYRSGFKIVWNCYLKRLRKN